MKKLTRRDFIKMGMLGMAGLAFNKPPIDGFPTDPVDIGRVSTTALSVYSRPSDKSTILYQRYRDELVNIYNEVISDEGPDYNPLWYRVWGGYIHSAHLVRVSTSYNPITYHFPENGLITEVTVPYSQSMRYSKTEGWTPLYRLYEGSVHWVIGIDEGPDGLPWYKIEDEMDVYYTYHVSAPHLRVVTAAEIAPISVDVPFEDKRIEVSIVQQTLTAYEGSTAVLHTKISSGIPNNNLPKDVTPTKTPRGTFNIASKMPSKHMGDGHLTSDIEAYEIPGVPWVCFFEPKTGVATHGTYWHRNFGTPMSHGCVNMVSEEAKWLFRWADPKVEYEEFRKSVWDKRGFGTQVIVY